MGRPPGTHGGPVAFSYIRFSDPAQAKGDSVRRQTEATDTWCQRNGIRLDTSLSLQDLGVSAFKGKHRDDKAALGRFLDLVKRGRVPRGSYLVIENLDRLTREDERTALRLWMDILDSGINIVQLTPETIFRHDRSDMVDLMRAIIELSRGHSESRIKSERVAKAWVNKRDNARKEGTMLTRKLPAWLEVEGKTARLVPERADAIRRIFELAAEGNGLTRIVRQLEAEGVPAFGRSGTWNTIYINDILRDRRVLGEYQPRTGGQPDGPPLKDYLPRVVSDETFYKAQAAVDGRKRPRGIRQGKHVNLFAGLLLDARDGATYYAATRREKRSDGTTYHVRILTNYQATQGRGSARQFGLRVFERALLATLAELDEEDVLGQGTTTDTTALETELAEVRDNEAALVAELVKGYEATIADALRQLGERGRELTAKLEEVKQLEAKPLADSWRELKTLAGLLDDPAARLRLRAALGRVVTEMRLLVMPRGRERLAAVQVWFQGGAYRTVWVLHRPAHYIVTGVRPGRWWAHAYRVEGKPRPSDDLRTARGVAFEEKALMNWYPEMDKDPSTISGDLP